MGKNSKKETLEKNKDTIAHQYDDLLINKDVVLCVVPSHDKTYESFNNLSPMENIIKLINKYHNDRGLVLNNLLLRNGVVEESKTGLRDSKKHLNSIVVNNKYKESIKGKTIYIFDDITTSGNTMESCVEILYRNNVGHVVCFSVARTCGDGPYSPKEIL